MRIADIPLRSMFTKRAKTSSAELVFNVRKIWADGQGVLALEHLRVLQAEDAGQDLESGRDTCRRV